MVRKLEMHERRGKDVELREKALLLKSAREQEKAQQKQIRFFCSDNVAWQNEMANRLVEWADKEDSRLIDAFPLSQHLSPRRFYKIAETNNYFAACLEYAIAKLGERMEDKIKDHPIHISKALPLYSTLWIQAEQKKQDAQNAISGPTNITVKMPNLGKEKKDV